MVYAVLVFEDKINNTQTLAQIIRDKFGYHTISADTVENEIKWIISGRHPQPDLILIDIANNNPEILRIIHHMKASKPQLPIIIIMQYGNDDYLMSAIAAGANDFLTKPIAIERLRLSIQNVMKIQNLNNTIARIQRKNTGYICFSDLIGKAETFKKTLQLAEKSVDSNSIVRIDGEQGTGRESIARAIHGSSNRAGKPFLPLNCEDMNPAAVENILFGSATSTELLNAKTCMLRAADQGTLYLNEITCLPIVLQQRLFNAINVNGEPMVDSHSPVTVDVRIMCSNSREPNEALSKGILHKDFHDMHRVTAIPVPSLIERKEDIAALAQHFLNAYAATENRFPAKLCEDAIQSLENHSWPGNIRQLANLLHRAVLLVQLDQIDAATLRLVQQLEPVHYSLNKPTSVDAVAIFDRNGQIKKLGAIESEAIKLALKYANGCMTRAARSLGIGRSTLYRKLEEMEAGVYMPLENQTTRPIIPPSARGHS